MIEAAIVIPVYKSVPSESEIESFKQCLRILGKHPIVFVTPTGLDISLYTIYMHDQIQWDLIPFASSYFTSTTGYSQLLLSRSFYKHFENYRYILIYQLDAWVFRDELHEWCALNMDYVGAPWLEAPPITSGKRPIINLSKHLVNKVGNGGFSLRKVQSHLKWAIWASTIFKLIPKNEDIIWSLFVPFKKPTSLKALEFAFEMDPEKSFEINKRQLPFGCHAWEKYNPEFWNRYISLPTSSNNQEA